MMGVGVVLFRNSHGQGGHSAYPEKGPLPMRAMSAREMIRAEYGAARNFVTPHVIRTGKLGPHAAYELAWGESIMDRSVPIYGLSIVLERDGETRRSTDRGGVFASESDAMMNVDALRAYLSDADNHAKEWDRAL